MLLRKSCFFNPFQGIFMYLRVLRYRRCNETPVAAVFMYVYRKW
jgi:hypothetical protein